MRSSAIAFVVSALLAFSVSASPLLPREVLQPGSAAGVDRRNQAESYQTEERRGNPKPKPNKTHGPTYNPGPTPCPDPTTPVSNKTTGVIQVHDDKGLKRAFLGYVASAPTEFGAYKLTQNYNEALWVRVDLTAAGPPNNLIALNSASPYSYVGGIVSVVSASNNINPGSSDYVFMGASNWSNPGSPAIFVENGLNDYLKPVNLTRAVESAIWTFDQQTRRLSPQWINTMLEKPVTHPVLVEDQVLIFTADIQATLDNWYFVERGIGPLIFTLG